MVGYYLGIPMFSYLGGYGGGYSPFSSTGSFARAARATSRATYNTAGAWPYGWNGYNSGFVSHNFIDSEQYSYNDAVQINRMIHNPAYIPYIDVSHVGGAYMDYSQARARGQNAAYKDILLAKFESLGTNLNSVISQAEQALATQDLTTEQKNQINNFINQAKQLLQKRQELANKSENMDVLVALREITNLQKEYYTLRDNIKKFSSGVSGTTGNNGSINPVVEEDDFNPAEIPEPIGDDEEISPEELKKRYEEQMKPAINEFLNNSDLSRADKKAITEKQKELEKAIADGKPIEELRKLYNELSELANGKQSDIITDNFKAKADELKADIDEIKENDNLTEEEKKAMTDKLAELEKAITDGKSSEEIQDIIDELSELKDRANVKIDYNENLKPQIDKIMNDISISEEEKTAITDKQKELEKAINRNRPLSEINKLKTELTGLINAANGKIGIVEEETETKSKQQEVDNLTHNIEEINIWVKENSKYLTNSEKTSLQKKIDEIKKYMEEKGDNFSVEELGKMRRALMFSFSTQKRWTEKLLNKSTEIAGNIYEAAAGNDFRVILPWEKIDYTEKEKLFIKNVKELNSDNIVIFLKKWEDSYRESMGDSCILETIRGEFLEYKGAKTEASLALHILGCIEKWANNNGLVTEKVKDKISLVRSLINSNSRGNKKSSLYNWDQVYKEFNKLLIEIEVRPKDGTVQ